MNRRNNEERTGAINNMDPTPQIQNQQADTTQQQNSLFQFSVPTEMVDLPSRGKLYPEGHPTHNKESIEIRFMTAKEEDILTSKSLLKKGTAIDKMLESVIMDKSIDINSLLIGDKNALIVAARITGYGNKYETKVTCPSCGANSKHMFDLSAVGVVSDEEDVVEGVSRTDKGTYKTTLPRTELEVEFRLLTGKDEKAISKLVGNRKKKNLPENASTTQIKTSMVSVYGHEDADFINKFVDNMPAYDAKYLRKVYSKTMPNVNLTREFSCVSCDHEQDMEVPLTADFFWPE